MSSRLSLPTKKHLLTIHLEDYFHAKTFAGVIQRRQWNLLETRAEQNVFKLLDLLDRFQIKATFFVLGCVAEQQPEVIKEVVKRGHEIASSSYDGRSIRKMTPPEFRTDLRRSRAAVERASGTKVLGYRTALPWATRGELWMLDILAEEGFAYDSSMATIFGASRSEPWRRSIHRHKFEGNTLWEVPISTYSLLGWRIPLAGGGYLRQLPHSLVKYAVRNWHSTNEAPLVMYFRAWEFDRGQPLISAGSSLAKLRHYRNIDKMTDILEDYFKLYCFVGIAEYLGLTDAREQPRKFGYNCEPEIRIPLGHAVESRMAPKPALLNQPPPAPVQVSVVIPCYNEQPTLPYLAKTLQSMSATLEDLYELRFIFVDDGSSDETWNTLQQTFNSWQNCRLIKHPHNRGIAAAIMTGINAAETQIVCSIDCDCTYDPHELRKMIPRLGEGVDLVTASPYHPEGMVRNVPRWRLALSKTSSFLYRQILRQKLFTYTSCFRVYRRSAVIDLPLEESGFLGVAELIGKLDFNGSSVVEYPATLEARLFGVSKMKTIRTILGHLALLTRLLALRLRRRKASGKILQEKDYASQTGEGLPAAQTAYRKTGTR